jgi:histidyl-tRNA synthetase
VGWAAGIERLAMLVGEVPTEINDIIIVAENDAAIEDAFKMAKAARGAGLPAHVICSGSPKKRFDKATKIGAAAIVTFFSDSGSNNMNVKTNDEKLRHHIRILFVELGWLPKEAIDQGP